MVEIINISHHPKIVLPDKVPVEGETNAIEFLEELCRTYEIDPELLTKKMFLLLDGKRVKENSIVKEDSKLYIVFPPIGG